MSKCAYCKYNDGAVYTSTPPKYRCTVTGEYHLALDDCNVEFAPVKHGHWIKIFEDEDIIQARCSACGMVYTLGKGRDPNYCGTCGAKMDEEAQP